MFKKGLLWVTVFLLVAFVCIYSFRNALVVNIAGPKLKDADIKLSCLDWSLSSVDTIKLNKACIEHPAATIQLIDANLSLADVEIGQMKIVLKESSKPSSEPTFQKLKLPLPIKRPLLTIKQLEVSGKPLNTSISLSVKEIGLNHFSISGDLTAQLSVYTDKIRIDEFASGNKLMEVFKPQQITSLSGAVNADFDGTQLRFSSKLALSAQSVHNDCAVTANISGTLSGELDLTQQSAEVDLSGLENNIHTEACNSIVQSYLPKSLSAEDLLAETISLLLPNKLYFKDGQISTKHVKVVNEYFNRLELTDLNLGISAEAVKSQLQFTHQSKALGKWDVSGAFELKQKQFNTNLTLEGKHANFPELLANQFTAQQTPLPIEFGKARFNSTLSAAGTINQVIEFEVNNQLELLEVTGESVSLPLLTMRADMTGEFSEHLKVTGKGALSFDSLKYSMNQSPLQGKGFKAHWQSDLVENDLQLELDWQLKGLKHADNQIQGLQQTLQLNGKLNELINSAVLTAKTHLDAAANSALLIEDINIESQGDFKKAMSFDHDINLLDMNLSFRHEVSDTKMPFELVMIEQDLTVLQPIFEQIAPKLKIETGSTNVVASGDLKTQDIDFDLQFNASALIDTHYINGAAGKVSGQLNSGLINIPKTKVTIGEFRSGAVLTNIEANLQAESGIAWLSDMTAEAFDGELKADKVKLTTELQRIEAKVENLDLAILAKAGREAGVTLTGRVSGELPIEVRDGKVSITEGKLYNLGAGLLSVSENASVNALKAQQPQLKTVIGLLDNLDIDTLHSDVALTEDGWLTLGVNIKGENKSQAQPVNFNYTHHENIYTLFKALRLNDEISQQVEKALTQ
ncbi:YdbH domain-containing protein [Pseudoalteromonas sp. MTN2-4]|uniref:intermembrane phospholipid transport protein YdbH family protein n=1 Tax=Pseudoalteromonas sp. MTN2-4 TaxID=3056555 RepID=UPI0036F3D7C3